jgi:hypothetical protein
LVQPILVDAGLEAEVVGPDLEARRPSLAAAETKVPA